MGNKWSVYVLSSLTKSYYYKGMSKDPVERLKKHNRGRVKATKHYRPLQIVYSELVGTREEARKREKYLKSAAGRRFLREKAGIGDEGSLPD